MSKYTKYKLYQKYETRGSQEAIPCYPNVFSIDGDGTQTPYIVEENSRDCGYTGETQPIYRWYTLPIDTYYYCDACQDAQYKWVNLPISQDWECDGTTKYYKQKKQVSVDGGSTWTDVSPAEYQRGAVYEYNSSSCGYITRTTSGTPYCEGYDKWVDVYSQYSTDGGNTWQTTATTPTMVERNSLDCGYVPPAYENQYFTLVARGSGAFKKVNHDETFYYSLDEGNTWINATKTTTISVNNGDRVMFMGALTPIADTQTGGIGAFSASTQFDVEGNPMSLLYGRNFRGQRDLSRYDFAFAHMFSFGGVVSIENLVLPATILGYGCYYYMFYGCRSLTSVPSNLLPATTLAYRCYEYMFGDCASLRTAPNLPATTLSERCYSWMFRDCTSLTTAPSILPATTLADYCYYGMFLGCTSLTTVPSLPATTLAHNCYYGMFQNCTSLSSVPSNLLPATTLADWCYASMFGGCTSLTTAPNLPATTLANSCYEYMFLGCTSLTSVPSSIGTSETTIPSGCCMNMFDGCTSLTSVPSNLLPATTLGDWCYYGMFSRCTSLRTAPNLPATTLANYCYYNMFLGCTSLTTAPNLPATTLVDSCYYSMFRNCSSLNYVKCLATNISAFCCTLIWLDGVASSGTFVKASSATWERGADGIPTNWTVQNA